MKLSSAWHRLARAVVLALTWLTPIAEAAEPPTAPQLRIEAGMHTVRINRIATDAQGRWAVTASGDKTARVWDVASGRLLQVLRPQIGPGSEGKLNAVALSPDGAVVAAAGWTGFDGSGKADVYLFNRSTGQLIRRLTGLPDVVLHLAFSPDGRWLAATLVGSNGVRIWRWAEGGEPLVDAQYAGSSFRAHFGPPDERGQMLATSSTDSKIRLYRLAPNAAFGSTITPLKVHAVHAAPDGQNREPYGVAFSPDGRLLAVGYRLTPKVDVLDGQTLALRYSPSTTGLKSGNLENVAFSADGKTLAAAGGHSCCETRNTAVRLWPQAGAGTPHDRAIGTVMGNVIGLAPLPATAGGGWLVGKALPEWGVLQPDGRWHTRGQSPIADMMTAYFRQFFLSDSGRVVEFGFDLDQIEDLYRFDLRQRRLEAVRVTIGQRPRFEGPLDGQLLKLDKYEVPQRHALLPGNEGFALGTNLNLRLYNPDGTPRWDPKPVPGAVYGVNIPQTGELAGKVIVAAFDDGTIRWHRVSDGQELLAFFPHADRQRWVLWTPSGYYDASPGGEDLIGWHVNRGADAAADFFAASRFRERFWRPDVIDRVLDTLDEAEALKQADVATNRRPAAPVSVAQVLPPVVEVLSGSELSTSSPELVLQVRARTVADAPVTGWRVRIDGDLAPDVKGLGRQDAGTGAGAATRELRFAVPPRDSEVRVFAENRHGVSTEGVVRVRWTGRRVTPEVVRPTLYVLAIGVGQYANSQVNSLGQLPAKDARDFVAAVQRQQGRLYERVEVKLLTDAEATRDNVVDALEWLQRKPRQFDVSMLFVSGHGVNDPAMGYLFLPVNADPDALKRTAVNWGDFKSTVQAMPGKRVVFMDTCHSGNALGTAYKSPFTDITGVLADLASSENGVVVFASSTGRQLSIQDAAWGNGAFTKAVVEGLNGAAGTNTRSEITHKRLSVYVSDRVRELTRGRQSPVNPDPVGMADFPLAIAGP